MTERRTSKTYSQPKLVVPREEAIRKIKEQIEIGRDVRDQRMFSMMDLESAQERKTKWSENNIEMLTRLFNTPFFKEEYSNGLFLNMDSAITFGLKEKYFKDDMNEQIGKLEFILGRLKHIPEMKPEELAEQELIEEPMKQEQPREARPSEIQPNEAQTRELKPREEPAKEKPLIEEIPKEEPPEELVSKEKPPQEKPSKEVLQRRESLREELSSEKLSNQDQFPGGNVLLIHGRDNATKESIVSFIEKLELRALILHEQANGGRSIIEKFGESFNIDFAIILLTPDDIVAPRNRPKERQTCVSQNVIFEFGYVLGKLGHGRVCVLYKEGVEIPSDFTGVGYIPIDSRGGWRLLVANEIKQAGIDIDLNKAI